MSGVDTYLVRIDGFHDDDVWVPMEAFGVRDAAEDAVDAAVTQGITLHEVNVDTRVRAPDGVEWKVVVSVEMAPVFLAGVEEMVQ